jgi:DNA-binding response OmpR family regulator
MAGRKVAVLERDPHGKSLLHAILVESQGWRVRFGGSVQELTDDIAWADVLLIDLHLPDTEGLEGIAEVRNTPVVVLTDDDDPHEAAPTGDVAAYVRKPFSVPELIGALRGAAPVIDLASVREIDIREVRGVRQT